MMKTLLAISCALAISAQGRPNILLICVDDLRPELASFGAGHIHSPNIDRLAETGRAFYRHYVNAPSCGPSRYTMLTGRFERLKGSAKNTALFNRAKQVAKDPGAVPPSMPEWFRKQGYTTVAVGKVSHHPGGRGGAKWNDPGQVEVPGAWERNLMPCGAWKTPRGAMHGLANGETRVSGKSALFQSMPGADTIYPDGLIVEEGLKQLNVLAKEDEPFFLAVGLIKPHLPFGSPAKYMTFYEGVEFPPVSHSEKPAGRTTWNGSNEFMKQYFVPKDPREDAAFALDVRRHYAACVSYADAHVGLLLAELRKLNLEDDTVILLWGDHGWHLGEHGVWGKHTLFEEALHAPLIIRFPGIKTPGKGTDALVETLDVFPTLCELTGVPVPAFVQGQSLMPQLTDPSAAGHTAIAFWGKAKTVRTERWRMIWHKDGYVELYDHTSKEKETLNVADRHPDVITELKARFAARK